MFLDVGLWASIDIHFLREKMSGAIYARQFAKVISKVSCAGGWGLVRSLWLDDSTDHQTATF